MLLFFVIIGLIIEAHSASYIPSSEDNTLYIGSDMYISTNDSIGHLNGTLILDGNSQLVNQGKFVAKGSNIVFSPTSTITGAGTLRLNGSGNQTIDANGIAIGCNLEISNSSNVTLETLSSGSSPSSNNDLQISNLLYLKYGKLITGYNKVVFQNGASYSGASNSSHIKGWCEKIGNTAFTFPVGDGSTLRTASIAAPTQNTDVFSCQYYHINPNDSSYLVSQKDASLTYISECEYWILNRTSGTSNVKVTLSWDDAYLCGINNLSNLVAAKWNGLKWNDLGNGGTTIATGGGAISSASNISSFSPFTLAMNNGTQPLPVELTSFSAKRINNLVALNWQTASEFNNDYFQIEKSKDALHWDAIGKISSLGNSTQLRQYQFNDSFPIQGINYYRLKQVDLDGSYTYSNVCNAIFDAQRGITWTAYPNPAGALLSIELSQLTEAINYRITDLFGRVVINGKLNSLKSTIDIHSIASGTYFLEVDTENSQVLKLLKQ